MSGFVRMDVFVVYPRVKGPEPIGKLARSAAGFVAKWLAWLGGLDCFSLSSPPTAKIAASFCSDADARLFRELVPDSAFGSRVEVCADAASEFFQPEAERISVSLSAEGVVRVDDARQFSELCEPFESWPERCAEMVLSSPSGDVLGYAAPDRFFKYSLLPAVAASSMAERVIRESLNRDSRRHK